MTKNRIHIIINESNKWDSFFIERRNNMPKNTRRKVDAKIFKRTAASTKKINVAPKIMRGGIRL